MMTERILKHYAIQVTRESTKREPFTHVQLTCDNETIFAADAYTPETLQATLRMLCDWAVKDIE